MNGRSTVRVGVRGGDELEDARDFLRRQRDHDERDPVGEHRERERVRAWSPGPRSATSGCRVTPRARSSPSAWVGDQRRRLDRGLRDRFSNGQQVSRTPARPRRLPVRRRPRPRARDARRSLHRRGRRGSRALRRPQLEAVAAVGHQPAMPRHGEHRRQARRSDRRDELGDGQRLVRVLQMSELATMRATAGFGTRHRQRRSSRAPGITSTGRSIGGRHSRGRGRW